MNAMLLDDSYLRLNNPDAISVVENLFQQVTKIANGSQQKATICTPCYNAKIMILKSWAEANGISRIAMGHHGTDAISSMLKSYYYYVDRWYNNNKSYDYYRYCTLIESQRDVYSTSIEDFLNSDVNNQLCNLIKSGFVGTDEPVVQYIKDSNIKLYHPMYGIYENDIISHYNNETVIKETFNYISKMNISECFLANYRNADRMTPRELIQFHLLSSANRSIMNCLLEKCSESMDERGFLKYNVRNNRSRILGSSYKDDSGNIKKL